MLVFPFASMNPPAHSHMQVIRFIVNLDVQDAGTSTVVVFLFVQEHVSSSALIVRIFSRKTLKILSLNNLQWLHF